jgi:putative membrane protein
MMTALLINLLATAIGLGCTILIISGIKAKNFSAFLIAATVLGLINAFIRPVLWLITAQLSVLTFGLFALVINALMIMLTASLVPGFEVKSFGSAFLGAVIMAIIGVIGFVSILLLTGADINWYSYEYHAQSF